MAGPRRHAGDVCLDLGQWSLIHAVRSLQLRGRFCIRLTLMQALTNDQGLLVIEAIPNLLKNIEGIRALAAADVDADGGPRPHWRRNPSRRLSTYGSFLLVQKTGKSEAADAQPVILAPAGIVQGALLSDPMPMVILNW